MKALLPLALLTPCCLLPGSLGGQTATQNDSSAKAAVSAKSLPLIPGRTLSFTATDGTWISLDLSPDGKTIVFELLILGMIAAPFLHCAMILDTLTRLVLGYPVLGGGLASAGYLGVLLAGYGSAFAVTLLGIVRQGSFHLLGIQALLPIYWLLMSWATLRALRELAVQPFYWFKSPHEPAAGTSRMTMSQAPSRSLT